MLTVAIIIGILLMLYSMVGFGSDIFWAPVILAAAFVGFWVLVFRMLIGFARWLIAPMRSRPLEPAGWNSGLPPVYRRETGSAHAAPAHTTASRTCNDSRCGQVNVSEARFCSRCGRPLRAWGEAHA